MTGKSTGHFADTAVLEIRRLGHPLCVGLDPYLPLIPKPFRRGTMERADPRTPEAVSEFLIAVLDRLAGKGAVVKPQIALFEQMGWRGWRVLQETVRQAGDRHILVLLDAKRGDIGSTAQGYADAYLGSDSPMSVDAVTVNPYMGLDAVEPFVGLAERTRRGVVVLVKNSNPGASIYQDLECGGRRLYEVVAESLTGFQDRLKGTQTGWSSLGVGGIVNASRSVLLPTGTDTGSATQWEAAFDIAVKSAAQELGEAVLKTA